MSSSPSGVTSIFPRGFIVPFYAHFQISTSIFDRAVENDKQQQF